MKIDKPGKPLPTHSMGDGAARANSNKGKASTPPPQQSDQTSVSLGATATQLHSMETSMANSPVANAEKVAEIKKAISDGIFKVNSEVVAERLIETVRSLIGNRA